MFTSGLLLFQHLDSLFQFFMYRIFNHNCHPWFLNYLNRQYLHYAWVLPFSSLLAVYFSFLAFENSTKLTLSLNTENFNNTNDILQFSECKKWSVLPQCVVRSGIGQVLSENYNLNHIRKEGSSSIYCGLLNTVRSEISWHEVRSAKLTHIKLDLQISNRNRV